MGFFGHLCIKVMILPRQARDKHRKNFKKTPFCRRWRTSNEAPAAATAAVTARTCSGEYSCQNG
jgi:hypothetical protein